MPLINLTNLVSQRTAQFITCERHNELLDIKALLVFPLFWAPSLFLIHQPPHYVIPLNLLELMRRFCTTTPTVHIQSHRVLLVTSFSPLLRQPTGQRSVNFPFRPPYCLLLFLGMHLVPCIQSFAFHF